jgi:hypothetical protein
VTKSEIISEAELEPFLDPLEECPEPPFEYMMILARQEQSKSIRKTLVQKQKDGPPKMPQEDVKTNRPARRGFGATR